MTVAPQNPPFTLDVASHAFRRFFDELREAFFERETLLTQIELALLCREHVLVTGPPGTAKSALANAVLGRIVDVKTGAPSLFSKQVSEATVQTDLIGPVNFKTLTETGRTEYLTEDGMLGAIHAFLDEVFDGRDMLLRSILNVLHERELKHGRKVTAGRLECAVMTSNRYLSEAVSRAPELLLAFADRLSFICYVPKSFARDGSRAAMLRRATLGQRPELKEALTIQHLDTLQAAVEKVEVPSEVLEGLELLAHELERALQEQVVKLPDYVPTKTYSQRSIVKALWALKAFVVRDRIFRSAGRPLTATIDDLAGLRHFFLLGGPPPEETELLLKTAVDPRERAQLEIIRLEQVAFDTAWQKAKPGITGAFEREAASLKLTDLRSALEALGRSYQSELATQTATAMQTRLSPGPRHPRNRSALLSLAQSFLVTVEQRIKKGVAGQGEGNGGAALLASFGAAIVLARKAPELASFSAQLTAAVRGYCAQALEMIALTAEGAEFDGQLKLEALATLGERLAVELRGVGELWAFVGNDGSEATEAFAAREAQLRSRVGESIRRRALALVGGAKKVDSFEALAASGRRIEQLEKSLAAIDPAHAQLRAELLGPIAATYARSALAQLNFQRIEQFASALRAIAEDVRREGLAPKAVLRQSKDVIKTRLEGFATSLADAVSDAAPVPNRALSGEAYVDYRQAFASAQLEGERAALSEIDAQLGGVEVFSQNLRSSLAESELNSIDARATFLKAWLAQVLSALPPAEKIRDRATADHAFERLVKSRFPLLATKEGELLKLQTSVNALADGGGELADRVHGLRAVVRGITEQFSEYSKALLDARARN